MAAGVGAAAAAVNRLATGPGAAVKRLAVLPGKAVAAATLDTFRSHCNDGKEHHKEFVEIHVYSCR